MGNRQRSIGFGEPDSWWGCFKGLYYSPGFLNRNLYLRSPHLKSYRVRVLHMWRNTAILLGSIYS